MANLISDSLGAGIKVCPRRFLACLACGFWLSAGCAPTLEGPQTTATPVDGASVKPQPPTSSDPLALRHTLTQQQDLVDRQITEGVLVARSRSENGAAITYWSGADGIRRVDLKERKNQQQFRFYFQAGRLMSLVGTSRRADHQGKLQRYTVWAGIGSDWLI